MTTSSNILEVANIKGVLKVTNPKTGRKVGVGSSTFRLLVKNKILDIRDWESNQVIYEGSSMDNAREVASKLNHEAMGIPKNKTVYVKNRKVMTRNRRVSRENVNQKMRELTIDIYRESPHLFVGKSPEEVVQLVNQLVMNKMVSDGNSSVKEKMLYIAENLEDSDEFDTDDDGEYSWDEEIPEGQIEEGQIEEGQIIEEEIKTVIDDIVEEKIQINEDILETILEDKDNIHKNDESEEIKEEIKEGVEEEGVGTKSKTGA